MKRWLKLLIGIGVVALLVGVPLLLVQREEPQVQARAMQVNVPHPLNSQLQLVGNPIRLSRTPVEYRSAPPILGQHTEQILPAG